MITPNFDQHRDRHASDKNARRVPLVLYGTLMAADFADSADSQ
jgi:hypothetical protein